VAELENLYELPVAAPYSSPTLAYWTLDPNAPWVRHKLESRHGRRPLISFITKRVWFEIGGCRVFLTDKIHQTIREAVDASDLDFFSAPVPAGKEFPPDGNATFHQVINRSLDWPARPRSTGGSIPNRKGRLQLKRRWPRSELPGLADATKLPSEQNPRKGRKPATRGGDHACRWDRASLRLHSFTLGRCCRFKVPVVRW